MPGNTHTLLHEWPALSVHCYMISASESSCSQISAWLSGSRSANRWAADWVSQRTRVCWRESVTMKPVPDLRPGLSQQGLICSNGAEDCDYANQCPDNDVTRTHTQTRAHTRTHTRARTQLEAMFFSADWFRVNFILLKHNSQLYLHFLKKMCCKMCCHDGKVLWMVALLCAYYGQLILSVCILLINSCLTVKITVHWSENRVPW